MAATQRPVRARPRARRVVPAFYSLLGLLTLLGLWSATTYWIVFDPYILPPPWLVAQRMWELLGEGLVFSNFASSLGKTFLGWLFAFAIGIPLGLAMGRYRYAKAFLNDFVYLVSNVPAIFWAVMSILLFGINPLGAAFIVMIVVLPVVLLNIAAGVESVDRELLGMSRAFKVRRMLVVRSVVLPTILPFVLAGARVSFANSWKIEALTELFGGRRGVGYQIGQAFGRYSVVDTLAWMFFFVIFVVLFERIVLVRLERWLFRWRPMLSESSVVTVQG